MYVKETYIYYKQCLKVNSAVLSARPYAGRPIEPADPLILTGPNFDLRWGFFEGLIAGSYNFLLVAFIYDTKSAMSFWNKF